MKYEYKNEFVNCIIPKLNDKDFIALDLHIRVQELEDFINKHKKAIETNNGFLSVSVLKAQKDPNKLYTKYTQRVEIVEKEVVTHKEQMPDRDNDLPF